MQLAKGKLWQVQDVELFRNIKEIIEFNAAKSRHKNVIYNPGVAADVTELAMSVCQCRRGSTHELYCQPRAYFLQKQIIVGWPRTGFGEFNNSTQSMDFLCSVFVLSSINKSGIN